MLYNTMVYVFAIHFPPITLGFHFILNIFIYLHVIPKSMLLVAIY